MAKKAAEDVNLGGRPTAYKPEFCDEVIELGKAGKSKAQMAAAFDVSRQTIDNWAIANADFKEALERAMAHCQAWWEDKGAEGMEKAGFNAQVWKTSVQARFREDYTERQQVDQNITGNMKHEIDAERFTRAIAGLATRTEEAGGD